MDPSVLSVQVRKVCSTWHGHGTRVVGLTWGASGVGPSIRLSRPPMMGAPPACRVDGRRHRSRARSPLVEAEVCDSSTERTSGMDLMRCGA